MPDKKQTGYPLEMNIFDDDPSTVEGAVGPDAVSKHSSWGLYPETDNIDTKFPTGDGVPIKAPYQKG